MLCKALERVFGLAQPLGLRTYVAADPRGGVPEIDIAAIKAMLPERQPRSSSSSNSRHNSNGGDTGSGTATAQGPPEGPPRAAGTDEEEGEEGAADTATASPAGTCTAGVALAPEPGPSSSPRGATGAEDVEEGAVPASSPQRTEAGAAAGSLDSGSRSGAAGGADTATGAEADAAGPSGAAGSSPVLILVPMTLGVDKVWRGRCIPKSQSCMHGSPVRIGTSMRMRPGNRAVAGLAGSSAACRDDTGMGGGCSSLAHGCIVLATP